MTAAIWHLIDSRTVGGAERHIASVVRALLDRGIPSKAVLYRDYGNNPWLAQLRQAAIPFCILGGSPQALFKAIAQERPGILHTHGYKTGILGRAAALMNRVPVATTFHSGERSGGRLGAYEFADEWTAITGPRIAVSHAVAARLPFTSIVIDNFMRLPAADETAPLPRRAAFVGRLSAEKCPALFCDLARSSGPGLEWHVYGDGPLRTNLEQRFGDIVRFHGVVPTMDAAWGTLGLLVMPSLFEGLPYAALEALAAGVPILGSRVGGLPEAIIEDKTGWLFEPNDLQTARTSLEKWLTLDERAQLQMRANCRQHIKRRFSEEEQMVKLLAVYHRLGYPAGHT